jgi:hypothetical protein
MQDPSWRSTIVIEHTLNIVTGLDLDLPEPYQSLESIYLNALIGSLTRGRLHPRTVRSLGQRFKVSAHYPRIRPRAYKIITSLVGDCPQLVQLQYLYQGDRNDVVRPPDTEIHELLISDDVHMPDIYACRLPAS